MSNSSFTLDLKMTTVEFTTELVFKLIIISQIAEFLWESYLSFRQHLVYKKSEAMPDKLIGIVKKDTFEKARVYGLDKSMYGMFNETASLLITLSLLTYNGFPLLWNAGGDIVKWLGYDPKDSEILQSGAFMFVMNVFSMVVKFPFSIYHTFVLEEKHGFNKQTFMFFIQDTLKQFLVMQVLSVLVTMGVTYIVMIGGKYFFIYLWVFTMIITFFFMTIYPSVIAPLFDKYTPLPDGELRRKIESLAASIEFPLTKLYVVEGSKRSSHSNAYFYGFFKNKRIVLFDTLLKKESEGDGKGCTEDEVVAVLGHELGHWKLNHVLKNIIIFQVNMLLVFLAFSLLFKYQPLYEAIGFNNSSPIIIGLLVLLQYVMAPYFMVLGWIMAQISRRYEFQADDFAKQLGRCYSLQAALIKLNADNLGFPIYDWLYSSFHHSHPPLLERLEALNKSE